tara:strand:- start:3053 stop:3721 length:669 start_codon:yes stop_codon:yes gene_type:complete
MKYNFTIRYELDCPLAIAVATYLDCEHYMFLHRKLAHDIDITEVGKNYYAENMFWKILGFSIGYNCVNRYVPPATFWNEDLKPHPPSRFSPFNFINISTKLIYNETDRNTTLSELIVMMDLPFYLYPFRRLFERSIKKLKIIKDLEDVEMVDRRAEVFGRNYNSDYLRKNSFILHKETYAKYFGENSEFFGQTDEEIKKLKWTDIKELDLSYVQEYIKNSVD